LQAEARSEKGMRVLQRSVEFVTEFLAELTDTSVLGVDGEGRDVVRVAAMPKTAIHQSQVRRRRSSRRVLL
jgi:hypothetical protein